MKPKNNKEIIKAAEYIAEFMVDEAEMHNASWNILESCLRMKPDKVSDFVEIVCAKVRELLIKDSVDNYK